jgi:hypothetical protein
VGGGSVYNFTTINIAAGSTLKLSGSVFAGPLYFLAQGAVTITGTLDLSGQSGLPVANSAQVPTFPGPGGYGGGAGSFGSNPAQPGLGPAGGKITGNSCSPSNYPQNGGITANQFLVPLVGGSGGGGGNGESGGAGGGALLIASSVSITVTGTITANGGAGLSVFFPASAGGAGGGVRLVAPTIAGTGSITAAGGLHGDSAGGCGQATNGIIRLEFFQSTFTGPIVGTLYIATPVNLFLPTSTSQPYIMVTSIGGVPVPPNPTGNFIVPDVVLNSTSPLAVNIQGTNIPAGTTTTLYFSTENFPAQQITSTPLAATATPGITTATATVTLNPGWSLGYIIASWTQ